MHIFETEKARFDKTEKTSMRTLRGKGNHVGSAIGKTVFFSPCEQLSAKIKRGSKASFEEESKRYFTALHKASTELRRLYGELRSDNDAAWIFLMQLTLLEDELFSFLPKLYLSEGKSAEETVRLVREYFHTTLCCGAGGENLAVLSLDIDDVALRILACLGNDLRLPSLYTHSILLSNAPLPSFVAERREQISGIVSPPLGKNSSIFELTIALHLPLICTEEEIPESLTAKNALIDGARGCLYIDPDLATLSGFTDLAKSRLEGENESEKQKENELLNKYGQRINFLFEIDSPNDVKKIRPPICDGIGKFCSEELYLIDMCPPDEELLFEEYRKIAESMPAKPVIIRALRTAGSVHLDSILSENENDSYGELYVAYDSTLRNQLRAVMRAAAYGTLSFCLPRALRYSDIFSCASLMEELSGELYEEEREFNPIPLGVSICDTASALMCDKLLEECDFLIIELEKLSLSLFEEKNPLDSKKCENTVPLDALRQILKKIQASSEQKKKKLILSIGKIEPSEYLKKDLLDGFCHISGHTESIMRLKKELLQKQKG